MAFLGLIPRTPTHALGTGRGGEKKAKQISRNRSKFFFYFYFFGSAQGMGNFLGQGSNPSHSSDNAGSLTARLPGNCRREFLNRENEGSTPGRTKARVSKKNLWAGRGDRPKKGNWPRTEIKKLFGPFWSSHPEHLTHTPGV